MNSEFSLSTHVYYLTRGFIASNRAFNLATHAFSMPTRAFNLATRAFIILIRRFELVTRGFKLETRGFELVTHGFELVTRNSQLVFCFSAHRYQGKETCLNSVFMLPRCVAEKLSLEVLPRYESCKSVKILSFSCQTPLQCVFIRKNGSLCE